MYQIKNNRKYSCNPIIEIKDNTERIVFISLLPKIEGDKLTMKILKLLNNSE